MAAVAQGGPGFPSPGPFQLETHRSGLYERARLDHLVFPPVSGRLTTEYLPGKSRFPSQNADALTLSGTGMIDAGIVEYAAILAALNPIHRRHITGSVRSRVYAGSYGKNRML